LSSKVHSFNDLSKESFPNKIILDTNFVLNFTHRFTQYPKAINVYDCTLFLKSLIYGNSSIYVPDIVMNEFCFHIYLNILIEYKQKHGISKKPIDVYGDNPRLLSRGHAQIKEAVKNLDVVCSKNGLKEGSISMRNLALKLMRKHNMLPADAFIGAVAIFNQIFSIATLDIFFAKSISQEPNVHVYLPDDLYVRHFGSSK